MFYFELHKMNLICNIQLANEKKDPSYIGVNDFERLNKLSINELETEFGEVFSIWETIQQSDNLFNTDGI